MTGREGADTIGPEHDAFSELLAGYVDDELTVEDRALVEKHLLDCARCRRGLQAQSVIRVRLMRETESPVAAGLAARVMERVTRLEEQEHQSVNQARSAGRRTLLVLSGWAAAAAIAAVWIWSAEVKTPPSASSGMMNMTPARLVTIDSHPGPISSAVITQFRRVDQSDLPHGLDLTGLKETVPFHVPALQSPHMRLISVWTTEVHGEPAAALAYRCHDRLVVQYVISEKQFFRHPQVRSAIAQQGVYAVSFGTVSTVAWPDLDSGSFLVGQFSPSELAAMRL